jgi:hypothetical protein
MPVVHKDCYGTPSVNALNLTIEVLGMTITVKAGSFINQGITYTFTEDQPYVVSPSDQSRCFRAALVKVVATGLPELVVDELILDGVDTFYDLDPAVHIPLYYFYRVQVPPNTTDLAPLNVDALRIIEQPT